ncbi:MAG: hypothetical protein JSR24_20795 [Proteobacteria bacterium]|nr:hypothetical protein [Pseudomonadota bacterium]
MTDGNSGSGNGLLYFMVGALCVAVLVGGFVMFGGGGMTGSSPSTAQAPAAASTPAPAAPTETKNITIEKKTVQPTRVIIEHDRDRH